MALTPRAVAADWDKEEGAEVLAQLQHQMEGDDAESDNVNSDCWGALEFVIVNDFPDIINFASTREQNVRFVFGLAFYVINIFIQGCLLVFISQMLMMPAFKSAQDLYRNFHLEAFENNEFSPSKFHDFPDHEKGALCNVAVAQTFITKILVFLWLSQNMGEFERSLSRCYLICTLPRLPGNCPTTEMVVDHHGTKLEEFWIICLNLKSKILLQVFIYIPKMMIATVLGFTGSLWLLASLDFGDLLLNSLALGFVTQVDEILATIFFPGCFIQNCLVPCAYRTACAPADQRTGQREQSYMTGIVKLLVTYGLVETLYKFQPVIPGYEYDITSACVEYASRQLPSCLPFQRDCFPTG